MAFESLDPASMGEGSGAAQPAGRGPAGDPVSSEEGTPHPRTAHLVRAGDALQSAASRLAEWVVERDDAPYEVHMAAHEAENAVEAWTDARKPELLDLEE